MLNSHSDCLKDFMLRKLSIVPIFLAMMMMTLATVLPHHHHQTMICIVEEVCGMDGCCDDEHTHHSDTNHNQDESTAWRTSSTARRKGCTLTIKILAVTPATYSRSLPFSPTY